MGQTIRYRLEIEAGPRPLDVNALEKTMLETPGVVEVRWLGMTSVSRRKQDDASPEPPRSAAPSHRRGPSATRPALDDGAPPVGLVPDPDDLPFE